MYNFFRGMPGIGSVLKTIEILQAILAELGDALSTLKEAEKKVDSDGSVGKAIFLAIAAIGGAITAGLAAIADPEPISKTALIVTAIGAIGLAIYAIIDVIDTIDKNDKEKARLQDEIQDLNRNKRKLEDLMDDLKRM